MIGKKQTSLCFTKGSKSASQNYIPVSLTSVICIKVNGIDNKR